METSKRTMKVGEVFTEERDVCASTGTNYLLARLEGGLALADTYLLPDSSLSLYGAPTKKCFVFRCVRPGEAAIQFGLSHASDPSHILYEDVSQILVLEDPANRNSGCGGWSDFRELEPEDQAIFDKVMGRIIGVDYTSMEVATQVVAGMNYCFYCEAKSITNPPEHYHAQITIFAPLPEKGEPYVTNIMRILEKRAEK